jgi:hypothetical protein
MKVQTDLKAGINLEEVWQGAQSTLANGANAAGSVAQGIAHQTQALANNPSVRQTAGKLMWWPFGPPQF